MDTSFTVMTLGISMTCDCKGGRYFRSRHVQRCHSDVTRGFELVRTDMNFCELFSQFIWPAVYFGEPPRTLLADFPS